MNSAQNHDKSSDHQTAIKDFQGESADISLMSVSPEFSQPRMLTRTDMQNLREILCQGLVGRGHMSVYQMGSDWMETMVRHMVKVSCI